MWKKVKTGELAIVNADDLTKSLIEVAISADFRVNLAITSQPWVSAEVKDGCFVKSEKKDTYVITPGKLLNDEDFLADFKKVIKSMSQSDIGYAGLPQYALGEDLIILGDVFEDIIGKIEHPDRKDKILLVPKKDDSVFGFPKLTARIYPVVDDEPIMDEEYEDVYTEIVADLIAEIKNNGSEV